MVKAILFDFWGTLVENGIFPSPVRQVMFILRLRMPFKDFIVRFEQVMMTKPYDDLNEAFTAVCKEFNVDPQPFIIEKLVGMWNKNELLGKPFLEVVEVLEFLKEKKFKVGLISNTTPTITRVLDKFGMNKHFDAVLYSYDCGLLKTEPEMFKQLCKKLKVKPEEAVMIGDSIPTDIIGARSAGLKAVLLDRRNRREFSPRIISLRDLKSIIEKGELDEFLSHETELNPMGTEE
ncbi:HAD family hydrolase [Candidatus Woesearchaeota archaeon]|nr:HAD family hydrolase [Candidatus Woesearchaeota archaeon]